MILIDLDAQADRDFGHARRRSSLRRLVPRVRGEPASRRMPPSFDEARRSLRAHNWARRGRRVVDPQKIVGRVGRRRDFDHSFMPLRASAGERWKRVNLAFHRNVDLPPVSLYKLGDAYFVEDGNHRVSVARFHGAEWIEAYVTEFPPARRFWDTSRLSSSPCLSKFVEDLVLERSLAARLRNGCRNALETVVL